MRNRKNIRLWQRPRLGKKAQEEATGFIIIVVIIIFISVIFLGIMIRKNPDSTSSRDTYQFLETAMQFTTDCAISYEPAYLSLSELIYECHEGISLCTSGDKPCDVLQDTLSKILDSTYNPSKDAFLKAYEFKIIYKESIEKEVINISKGICTNRIKGSELPIDAGKGVLINSIKLCY